jgi:prolyl-tRNA editing enzyme YbaK/EbsC (Cys-tRNA(Pro) deacylase)
VFAVKRTREPLLVITSGANRVNMARLRELVGERVIIAHPDYVRKHTGFSIGGVPPVGHRQVLHTIIDEDLLLFDRIWAAAGTPHAVFALDPRNLEEITGGSVTGVT